MTTGNPTANALYYGDNLTVLREHLPDESVDLPARLPACEPAQRHHPEAEQGRLA